MVAALAVVTACVKPGPGNSESAAERSAAATGFSDTAETVMGTLTAPPSFAAKWLVPRLGHFEQAHPQVDVWLSAGIELVDLTAGEVDVAIRYGTGRYPGLTVEPVLIKTTGDKLRKLRVRVARKQLDAIVHLSIDHATLDTQLWRHTRTTPSRLNVQLCSQRQLKRGCVFV